MKVKNATVLCARVITLDYSYHTDTIQSLLATAGSQVPHSLSLTDRSPTRIRMRIRGAEARKLMDRNKDTLRDKVKDTHARK